MAVPMQVAHGWEEGTWREGHRQAGKPTLCGHVVHSETLQELSPLLQDLFFKECQSWKGRLRSSHCVSRERKLMIIKVTQ